MINRRHIYFYYDNDKMLNSSLSKLFKIVTENHFTIVDNVTDAKIIISIGNDDTFLQAVRYTKFLQDVIYLGVSTSKEPQSFCDFTLGQINNILKSLTKEDIRINSFPLLEVKINDEQLFYCLNQISIKSALIKPLGVDVFIDEVHFESFKGNGLLITTPMGSASSNKLTDGAIIDPFIRSMQVSELGPINNNHHRTLGSPFVLSENRTLKLDLIQDGNDHPIIGLDNEAYPIRQVKTLSVNLSNQKIHMIDFGKNAYWEHVKRVFL